jgi:hypothetical protein
MGRLVLKQASGLYRHFFARLSSVSASLPWAMAVDWTALGQNMTTALPGARAGDADPPFPSRTSAYSAPQCFPSSARLAVQVSCAKQKRIIQYTKT